MANSMNRRIDYGELVVIKKDNLLPFYHSITRRVGVARGGFGMSHETMGCALSLFTLDDGEFQRFEGNDIHRLQTAELHVTIHDCDDPQGFNNFTPRWRDAFWRTYTILRNRTAMSLLTSADTWEGDTEDTLDYMHLIGAQNELNADQVYEEF